MTEEQGGHEASFEERLAAARGKQGLEDARSGPGKPPDGIDGNALAIGMRVGVEMVSALVVAVAIGWGLDWLFGTRPILLAVFVLLGGAAGVLNVWRVFAPKHHTAPGKSLRAKDGRAGEVSVLMMSTLMTGDYRVAAGSGGIDALGQFRLEPALGPLGRELLFTQANLMMVVASVLVMALLWFGARPRAMVPGRLQSAAEMAYETVMSMCVDTIGPEGKAYFPFVFTLFFFILFGNLLGVWTFDFTFTSHIAVTLALSLLVFVVVTFVALRIHGLHFFSYFMPAGVPMALAPLLIPIEILSYLSRIISLSVRLFANMMAGHVMLEVFGAFVIMLGGAGLLGIVPAALSFSVNVALIGFELLVAVLQAYVFAVLTCIYLHDAVHLH